MPLQMSSLRLTRVPGSAQGPLLYTSPLTLPKDILDATWPKPHTDYSPLFLESLSMNVLSQPGDNMLEL